MRRGTGEAASTSGSALCRACNCLDLKQQLRTTDFRFEIKALRVFREQRFEARSDKRKILRAAYINLEVSEARKPIEAYPFFHGGRIKQRLDVGERFLELRRGIIRVM